MALRSALGLLLLLLALAPAWTAPDPARAAHEALVRLVLPGADAEALWRESEGLRPYLAALPPLPDARAYAALLTSPDPAVRNLAARLRQAYAARLYGSPDGRRLAGLPDPPAPGPPRFMEPPPLRPLDLEEPVDWAVVGSGPAGAVLAHELSRTHRVVLVERGSFVLPGAMDTREEPRLKDSGGARPTADGLVLVRNAVAVGGGSTVNIDLAFAPTLPMIEARLERWRQRGEIDREWFSRDAVAEAYGWVKETLGVRSPAFGEVNRNNRILWDGALASGWAPRLYDLTTWPPGKSPWSATDKRSVVEALILPAMREHGLQVLSDTEVVRVLVADGRATGLDLEARTPWERAGVLATGLAPGTRATLKARNVILCAGAQGTAMILQRSGLQAGRGVVLHPAMPLVGEFDHEIGILEGTPSTVYAEGPEGILYESTSAGPEYLALAVPAVGEPLQDLVRRFPRLGGFGVLLVDESRPENRVGLAEDGSPRVEYSLSVGDRRRFAAGVAEGIRILFRAGARSVVVPTSEDVLGDGAPARGEPVRLSRLEQAAQVEARLQFLPGATFLTSAHMQSGCAQHLSPRGEVLGVQGLYAMDASFFPESVGANPMQTIATFARIMGKRLRGGQLEDPGAGSLPRP